MANRYWVSQTDGNWNDTANWAAFSGGGGGASVPGIGDTANVGGAIKCTIDAPVTVDAITLNGGSVKLAINNNVEVRVTGDMMIDSYATVLLGTGAKLILWGTQDQNVFNGNYLNANVPITLDKPAGILKLTGDISLRSDLLRDPSEIDPRTATLLDIKCVSWNGTSIVGDVACRSYNSGYSDLAVAPGVTLDTFSFSRNGSVNIQGTIRVCKGHFSLQDDWNGGTLIEWTEPPPGPAKPDNFKATAVSPTQINLSWNSVSGATSYVLERTVNYANPGSWTQVYSGSATSVTDSGLAAGTLYYYRLKAVNANGNSGWSQVVDATTPTYPAPKNLTTSDETTTSVTLQWTSEYNPTDHWVAWSLNGIDSWTDIQTNSQSSFVVAELTSDTTYYFRVRAGYNGSHSPWSAIVDATTHPLPEPEPVETGETWTVLKRISQKFEVKHQTSNIGNRA
ncbi:MAG: fibronectin type III domain-containing protein [Planctomycetaceae bacterium]|nr:fibronectin type III domain-containing protein [Planctomycetaceae bacterium]